MTLTAAEIERGWVAHVCDVHGFLVATIPEAVVNCRCKRVARIVRNGRVVTEKLKPTTAKARELNKAGHPFTHGCGCGQDFGGKSLLRRHRVGGSLSKRCLSPAEMTSKGWFLDPRGKWRQQGAFSPTPLTDFPSPFPQASHETLQAGHRSTRGSSEPPSTSFEDGVTSA